MKKFIHFIFSMQLTGTLLLVFAGVIGIATFVENDLGTLAARLIIYDSRWFEMLLLILSIVMIGSIFKYKLYSRKKYTVLLFHLSFVVILIGSAITRYIGYEGMMHIRENESSNQVISSASFIQITVTDGSTSYSFSEKKTFNPYKNNHYNRTLNYNNTSSKISLVQYIPNAVILNISHNNQNKQITLSGGNGIIGEASSVTVDNVEFTMSYGSKIIELPFSLFLRDFQLDRYPGSMSPSSFASEVTLIDKINNIEEPRRIFMNNILNYDGYRFFQSSYDKDEKGTVLSVNHDRWGTFVTYIGYFIMALGMLLNFFHKDSRFRHLMKSSSKRQIAAVTLLFMTLGLLSPDTATAQYNTIDPNNYIDIDHAREFGKLLVVDQKGRIEPINTLASQIVRKVTKKSNFMGLHPDQVFLGMVSDPRTWQAIPIINVSDKELKSILRVRGNRASFNNFFDPNTGKYKLTKHINKAYNKKPASRNRFDKEIIKVDERVNICYMVYTGSFLKIFPLPNDANNNWFAAEDSARFTAADAPFVKNILKMYYTSIQNGIQSGNWAGAAQNLSFINTFQAKFGSEIFPSKTRSFLEVLYNDVNIFKRLFPYFSLVGFLMLILLFASILNKKYNFEKLIRIGIILIIIGFVFQTLGLGIRWYIAGHAPWSDGYETMIYISWAIILSGLFFIKKSKITVATTAILSSFTLMVANFSWLDPEITNLVPVLKSYWLVIHVAIITASYSFLAISALLGFMNLLLMNFKNKFNKVQINATIKELTNINEMNLIIGGFLMTIGTFLGAVWANESWGRYWGWDPKETWALVTVIVYAFVVHMRMTPGLRGVYAFNFAALISFSSVLMTYFGVNYYLSGMHSYAQGDPVPVPNFVYYAIIIIGVISFLAYVKENKFNKEIKSE
ncbi:MAG: cytochrome c biogenesis protein CcsA [Bacteroidetes bacterium]|nr:cytochrome c biogenesis protein CcsA [Bacteroidota bacterium]